MYNSRYTAFSAACPTAAVTSDLHTDAGSEHGLPPASMSQMSQFCLMCTWPLKQVADMFHYSILTVDFYAPMNSHLTFQTVTELYSLSKWEKTQVFLGDTD